MSTRSRVGYIHEDGTISSIYIHNDGYYEGVGQMLLEYYNSIEQAKEIVSFGDASFLEKTLKDSIFYARDNGERDTDACVSENFLGFRDICSRSEAEYAYLWLKDGWKTGLNRMVSLKSKLKKAP